MRTKTLLLTAAVAAAGLTSALAQGTVYSVNAVGFVNVSVPAGAFAILANPLNQPTNDLGSVLADATVNTKIFTFNPSTGTFGSYTKRSTGWTPADATRLDPGTAFFIQNVGTAAMPLTFIGEVPQGPLSKSLVSGFNLVASQVPQAGLLETDLKLPAVNNDKVYTFNGTTYNLATRRTTTWSPSEPTVQVAQGFWFQAGAAVNWTRTFSVNN